jgi:D-alanine-D-alanine ligase
MIKNRLPVRKSLKVLVVGGGLSSEHEVSLKTSKMIIKNLDVGKYDAHLVIIGKDGKWRFGKNKPVDIGAAITKISRAKFDFVFIALHGVFGEDGRIQALCEWLDIPYDGSGVLASALAMDKQMANVIYSESSLRVPPYVVVDEQSVRLAKISFPVVVKPVDGGSSVGISIVKIEKEMSNALKSAFRESQRVMVQKYIKGKEITCGIIEDNEGRPFALPPTEIVPRDAVFFDYHAKYATGGSSEITPARIPSLQIKEVQKLAIRAHNALGCRGMSRSDFILSKGKFYILETNTIPGMTDASLLPKAAAAGGISFPALLDMIIDAGLRK